MSARHFEGTCDVCGAAIALDDTTDALFDIGVTEDGRVYTWIRHYATAPLGADPKCAIYSSVVWLTDDTPRSDEGEGE